MRISDMANDSTKTLTSKNIIKSILWILVVAAIYCIVGRLSSFLIFEPQGIVAVWPASGIFLSAVLLTKKSLRPYIILVLFITDYCIESMAGSSPLLSLLYAFSLTLDATLSAWILRRILGNFKYFSKVKDFTVFIIFSVVLSNAIASTIASFGPLFLQKAAFWESWRLWWSSDAVGNLLITPFILRWFYAFNNKLEFKNIHKNVELIIISVVIILVSYFSLYLLHEKLEYFLLLNFISFPFLIWSVVRFEIKGATLTSVILTSVILFFEISSSFSTSGSQLTSIINIQLFFAIASSSAFYLAAVITERNQAKLRIEKSEKDYKDVVQTTGDLITVVAADGTLLFVNYASYDFWGILPEDAIGTDVFGYIYPEDRKETQKNFDFWLKSNESKFSLENRQFHISGKVLLVSWNIYVERNTEGKVVKLTSIARNVTQEREAIQEKIKLADMVENSLNEIYLFNEKTLKFEYLNRGALKNIGYSLDEMKELTPADIKPEISESEFQSIIKPLQTGEKENLVFTTVHQRKDKSTYPVEVHMQLIKQRYRKIYLAIINDITDRKKYEEQLIAAREKAEENEQQLHFKNQEYESVNEELRQTNEELFTAKEKAEESDHLKTAFLQNMSHELRTPMNAIMGFSELLKNSAIDEKQLKYATIIEKRSNDLLNIMNDLFDISKIESNQIILYEIVIEINKFITDFATNYVPTLKNQNESNASFTLNSPEKRELNIRTDPDRLKQVLVNLISNAFKFTKDGNVELGYSLDNENNHMLFYVKDTGIGIHPTKHNVIFERFRQADEKFIAQKFGGSGLGLSIAKGILELMGGNIWVESEEGKGSVFYFKIPYIKENINFSEESIYGTLNINIQGKTILVVEDDIYNAEYLKALLDDTECTLLLAPDGKTALETFNEYPDISLVLLDIKLPDINGFDVAKSMLEIKPDMKIIAQTAYASPSDKTKCMESGFCGYIAKPIKSNELYTLIESHL